MSRMHLARHLMALPPWLTGIRVESTTLTHRSTKSTSCRGGQPDCPSFQKLPSSPCLLMLSHPTPLSQAKSSLFPGFMPHANTHSRCAHYRAFFMFCHSGLSPSPTPIPRAEVLPINPTALLTLVYCPTTPEPFPSHVGVDQSHPAPFRKKLHHHAKG